MSAEKHALDMQALAEGTMQYSGYLEKPYTKDGKQHVAKVSTVTIAPDCIAAAAHPWKEAKEGQEMKAYIFSTPDPEAPLEVITRVKDIDTEGDFMLLGLTDPDIKLPAPTISMSSTGTDYLLHGMSSPSRDQTSVRHGIVSSARLNSKRHFFGDSPSGAGDSGGGVFNATSELIGMQVGRNDDNKVMVMVPASILYHVYKKKVNTSTEPDSNDIDT